MFDFGFLIMLLSAISAFQEIKAPEQPTTGPGSSGNYVHQEVLFQDFAAQQDGYWLFEPASPRPDSAPVVVFNHGYGAYNPMIYGKWIKHLVLQGNIVIYPRYQKNIFVPSTRKFVANTAKAIRDAKVELDTGDHVKAIWEPLTMVGHSYGASITANLAIYYDTLGIPQPKGILLCAPGTGPFKGSRLESYEQMPANTNLLIIVSEYDYVVGSELGQLIYETAINTPNRNLIMQWADGRGTPSISAGHNEPYSLDEDFDTGIRNITTRRALRIAKEDAVDYYGYWKFLDALMDYTRFGTHYDYAFGNTTAQRFMGNWSDGTPVKPFDVLVPSP